MLHMTLRWFGTNHDTVPLKYIRQIPGVEGVITTLYDIPAGEVWPSERIRELKTEVEAAGLKILGIESVNIHDAIKIGSQDRERYIDNYIETLRNLGKEGITTVCYNFMPVFDWTRTDLAKERPDGSTVFAYDEEIVRSIDPLTLFDHTTASSEGFLMPGWEPERLANIKDLFEAYKEVDEKTLFDNLVYFLKRIRPVARSMTSRWRFIPTIPSGRFSIAANHYRWTRSKADEGSGRCLTEDVLHRSLGPTRKRLARNDPALEGRIHLPTSEP